MRARRPRIGLAALLIFLTLTCQSGPEIATDGEHSPGDQAVVPITTGTSLSIEEGTAFLAGDTITMRAEVTPAPDGGNVLFFATIPVHVGAPVAEVAGGVASRKVVCGSPRVPFGSHTAQAQYPGTDAFLGSMSTTIPYTCLEAPGD